MTYADPSRCPSCGTLATGSARCPRCGIELRGARSLELLRLLGEADSVLADLRAEASVWRTQAHAVGAAASVAPGAPPAPPSGPGQAPIWQPAAPVWQPAGGNGTAYPRPGVDAPAASGRWTVGGTLLTLGALCLIVAAFVFVAVTWSRIGLTGRSLILLAVTSAACAAAAWLTTRRLRASAESMWTVTGFLAALDAGAATSAGLLGLDDVDGEVVVLVFSTALALAGWTVALWSRRWMPTLVSAQLGVAIGVTGAAIGLVLVVPIDLRWTLTPVAAVVVVLALACWRGALLVAAWATGLAGASMLGLAAVWIVTAAAIAPSFESRWSGGEAPAALLHGVLVVVIAAVADRMLAGHVSRRAVELIRGVAAFDLSICVGVVFLLLGAQTPVELAATTWVAVPLAAATLAVVRARPAHGWVTGLRTSVAVLALPMVGGIAVAGVVSVGGVLTTWAPSWQPEIDRRIATDGPMPAAVAFALVVGGAALLAVVSAWPVPSRTPSLRRALVAASAALGAGAVGVLLVFLELPVLVLALGLLVAVATAAVVWLVTGVGTPASNAAACVAVVGVVLAALAPIGSAPAAAATWSVGALVAGLVAATALVLVRTDGPERLGGAAVASVATTALAVAAVLAWSDVAGASTRTLSLIAAGLAVALLAAVSWPQYPSELRQAIEVVVGATAAVSVGFAAVVGVGATSMVLTVLGAGAVMVGLLRADRRPYAAVGSVMLGLAYVLRLIASDVDVVEAYTLPFGVLLLLAGLVVMRREPERSSDVLLPGLALALLPSVPQTLAEPTSLRGLLVALAAVVVLGVGVVLRWRVPFLLGAALTTLLVVRWAGPVVGELPRWIPLGCAGILLVVAGATWEARVRDARAAVAYVQGLR
ncbi:SCO7613 C-terminal domain-containing membrane protein [Mumia sp. Pv 4-285]|uniref:SCO7613 C-terminal domain-containing membrane protein n=1 Tax=Mumia qirimensis TaxID=3234852 RepID=UPI00351CFA63